MPARRLKKDEATNELFDSVEERSYSARRSQLEIQMDILKVVLEGAYLPTQIMYRANLGWVALQSSLGALVGRGLLDRVDARSRKGNRSYQLTDRGMSILTTYNGILENLDAAPSLIGP